MVKFVEIDIFLLFADELASLAARAVKKKPEDLTKEEKMALLGRPKLGDSIRAQIRIKESKEFKVRFFFVVITKHPLVAQCTLDVPGKTLDQGLGKLLTFPTPSTYNLYAY